MMTPEQADMLVNLVLPSGYRGDGSLVDRVRWIIAERDELLARADRAEARAREFDNQRVAYVRLTDSILNEIHGGVANVVRMGRVAACESAVQRLRDLNTRVAELETELANTKAGGQGT